MPRVDREMMPEWYRTQLELNAGLVPEIKPDVDPGIERRARLKARIHRDLEALRRRGVDV